MTARKVYNHPAQFRPFTEILHIEAQMVSLSHVVEVAGVEMQEVGETHGADGCHFVLIMVVQLA
jgi:hypothetical protein